MWSEQALSLIRSHAGIIKRSSTAGKRRGNQKSPEQSRCLRHRAQINVMTRLLEATKCNQNPLQGSVRRLSNQLGSPMPPPTPHPHLYPLSKPDLRLPARSAEKLLKPPSCSSSREQRASVSIIVCVSHIWMRPSVWFVFSVCPVVRVCTLADPGPSRTPSSFPSHAAWCPGRG